MKQTARRAMQATAALAGMATAFGIPGTALAATPGHAGLAQEQAPGAALNSPSAAPSANELHSFQLPSHGVPVKRDSTDAEDQSSSDEYSDDGYSDRGYTDNNRSSDKARQRANADQRESGKRDSHCEGASDADTAIGSNGNRADDYPDADDYDEGCTGYHAPKGANAYDDDQYLGSDQSKGRGRDHYQFGGLI
ncbi:hypothetical protein [Pseudonocardia spinosispora]|uniref:hypothetical protein n=1 Tax=Pseudonocardia spinosispora TaxID=103441 RepID=UPI00040E6499|nr:hypothetical protein [Pseudonocardia spinosispora]